MSSFPSDGNNTGQNHQYFAINPYNNPQDQHQQQNNIDHHNSNTHNNVKNNHNNNNNNNNSTTTHTNHRKSFQLPRNMLQYDLDSYKKLFNIIKDWITRNTIVTASQYNNIVGKFDSLIANGNVSHQSIAQLADQLYRLVLHQDTEHQRLILRVYPENYREAISTCYGYAFFRTHGVLNKTHAIKTSSTLQLQGAEDPRAEAAFYTLFSKDNHAGLIRPIIADILPQRVVLVTDYLPFGSLERKLSNDFFGTQKHIKKIFCGIAYTLDYLHNHMTTSHLDLKPDNILLDSDYNPYIFDLGMSTTTEFSDFPSPPHQNHYSSPTSINFYDYERCLSNATQMTRLADDVRNGHNKTLTSPNELMPRFTVPFALFFNRVSEVLTTPLKTTRQIDINLLLELIASIDIIHTYEYKPANSVAAIDLHPQGRGHLVDQRQPGNANIMTPYAQNNNDDNNNNKASTPNTSTTTLITNSTHPPQENTDVNKTQTLDELFFSLLPQLCEHVPQQFEFFRTNIGAFQQELYSAQLAHYELRRTSINETHSLQPVVVFPFPIIEQASILAPPPKKQQTQQQQQQQQQQHLEASINNTLSNSHLHPCHHGINTKPLHLNTSNVLSPDTNCYDYKRNHNAETSPSRNITNHNSRHPSQRPSPTRFAPNNGNNNNNNNNNGNNHNPNTKLNTPANASPGYQTNSHNSNNDDPAMSEGSHCTNNTANMNHVNTTSSTTRDNGFTVPQTPQTVPQHSIDIIQASATSSIQSRANAGVHPAPVMDPSLSTTPGHVHSFDGDKPKQSPQVGAHSIRMHHNQNYNNSLNHVGNNVVVAANGGRNDQHGSFLPTTRFTASSVGMVNLDNGGGDGDDDDYHHSTMLSQNNRLQQQKQQGIAPTIILKPNKLSPAASHDIVPLTTRELNKHSNSTNGDRNDKNDQLKPPTDLSNLDYNPFSLFHKRALYPPDELNPDGTLKPDDETVKKTKETLKRGEHIQFGSLHTLQNDLLSSLHHYNDYNLTVQRIQQAQLWIHNHHNLNTSQVDPHNTTIPTPNLLLQHSLTEHSSTTSSTDLGEQLVPAMMQLHGSTTTTTIPTAANTATMTNSHHIATMTQITPSIMTTDDNNNMCDNFPTRDGLPGMPIAESCYDYILEEDQMANLNNNNINPTYSNIPHKLSPLYPQTQHHNNNLNNNINNVPFISPTQSTMVLTTATPAVNTTTLDTLPTATTVAPSRILNNTPATHTSSLSPQSSHYTLSPTQTNSSLMYHSPLCGNDHSHINILSPNGTTPPFSIFNNPSSVRTIDTQLTPPPPPTLLQILTLLHYLSCTEDHKNIWITIKPNVSLRILSLLTTDIDHFGVRGRGTSLGTLMYQSPENANRELCPFFSPTKSDIYSLGLILLRLLFDVLIYEKPLFDCYNFSLLWKRYETAKQKAKEKGQKDTSLSYRGIISNILGLQYPLYSPSLMQLLEDMLCPDFTLRPSIKSVIKIMETVDWTLVDLSAVGSLTGISPQKERELAEQARLQKIKEQQQQQLLLQQQQQLQYSKFQPQPRLRIPIPRLHEDQPLHHTDPDTFHLNDNGHHNYHNAQNHHNRGQMHNDSFSHVQNQSQRSQNYPNNSRPHQHHQAQTYNHPHIDTITDDNTMGDTSPTPTPHIPTPRNDTTQHQQQQNQYNSHYSTMNNHVPFHNNNDNSQFNFSQQQQQQQQQAQTSGFQQHGYGSHMYHHHPQRSQQQQSQTGHRIRQSQRMNAMPPGGYQ